MKRKEFLFVYESVNANANGDPLNENRPRIDEETGLQYVTMYRIKRTIRDYLKLLNILNPNEGNHILYSQREYENNNKIYLKTLEMVLKEETDLSIEDITRRFIDVRLFGGLFGIKDANLALQGPVQISYGQSYHKVKEQEIQISAVMPSVANKKQGTLGLSYIVPYAVIGTDGTVNQYNATKTGLTEEDVELMFEALWNGTTELKTTSKNQKSLFLVIVDFKEEFQNTYIGNLKDYIKLSTERDDLEIRNTKDYSINIDDLIAKLNNMAECIDRVRICRDISLKLEYNGEKIDNISDLLEVQTEEKVV